jgi:DNA-binding CsgD family transcriptional regulator
VLGEAVLRLLSAAASDGRAATLIIEDVHWSDAETLAVFEYLAENVANTRVLLLATVRDGVPGIGTELAASLVDRRDAVPIRLHPLSADDVVALAHDCLGDVPLPPDAADAVVIRSEGIPFLIEELLATAARSGWATIDAAVPGSVATSVATRLDALPPSSRQLLAAAALLGRHFDFAVAAEAVPIPQDAALEVLRDASKAQLIEVDGAGFRFRHALTRDAVLATTAPAERAVLACRALSALRTADPSLAGERCLVASNLAAAAGQLDASAGLLLQAAERAMADGALASADALATRAREIATDAIADEADALLLRVCALAGQTERAAALGVDLLAARPDATAQADLHLVLASVEVAAGRWDAADGHAAAARSLATDTARLARADAVAAQAAMGRYDTASAIVLAAQARDRARATNQPAVLCEALEVIGRAERGRDVAAAEAAFAEAHDTATAAGLPLWLVRALQELGTIDLFDTLEPSRLVEARRVAVELGALFTVAVVDLQLGALHDERGELDLALAAARRCEEASRRWRLSTLPMSLAVQAAVHARAGRRTELEAAAAAAFATGSDEKYVEVTVHGNAMAVFHIVTGDLPRAATAADRAMVALRQQPGAVGPVPGLWALLRTVLDDGGDAARAEAASLESDAPVSREMLMAAEAVAVGRAGPGQNAVELWSTVDHALGRHQGGFRRALVRMLVAPVALTDGWGEPIGWLRESLAVFEAAGLDAFAAQCRHVLREAGGAVPRRGRGAMTVVPPMLAALGVTSREVDVLVLVAAGATNREAAERLFISIRTVDKHVERLLQKTATPRSGLAEVAGQAGLLRT